LGLWDLKVSTRGTYFKFRRRRGRLFEGGGRLFNFSQIVFRYDRFFFFFFFFYYMNAPVPQKDPVSLEELRHVTPLAGLGLLHKVGWALGNESAVLYYHPLRRSMCSA